MPEGESTYSVEQKLPDERFINDVEFIARDNKNKQIGTAVGRVEGGFLNILNLYTNMDSRRLGIGDALLQRLLSWGKECGATHIKGKFRPAPSQDPVEIIDWYRKRGIGVTEDGQLTGDIEAIQRLRMVL